MTIYDDINNAGTVDELRALYQTAYSEFTGLRQSLNQKGNQRNALSLEIEQIAEQLKEYGQPRDVRDAFYLRLGELRKDDIE